MLRQVLQGKRAGMPACSAEAGRLADEAKQSGASQKRRQGQHMRRWYIRVRRDREKIVQDRDLPVWPT